VRIEDRYYGTEANSYDAKRKFTRTRAAEDAAFDELFAIVQAEPIESVLDLPSGTGRWIERISKAGLAYTGVDVSADMLRHAKAEADRVRLDSANLVEADCFSYLPGHKRQFDFVLSTRFINWWDEAMGLQLIELFCGASSKLALFHLRLDDTKLQRAFSIALRYPNRLRKALKDRDHLARELRSIGRSGAHPYISYHNRTRVMETLTGAGFSVIHTVVLRRHSYGSIEFWLARRK
jgi:SAM-dependent methyltransferase